MIKEKLKIVAGKEGIISDMLTRHTISESNFEEKRNYISLSHIALPEEELIRQYTHGFDWEVKTKLKCYKGYQMEKDLLQRIVRIFDKDQILFKPEIVAFDNGQLKILGHPECLIDGWITDCKSVLKDEWLPENTRGISRKIFWQMQGYMRYNTASTKTDYALVIFESRESGIIRDYWIKQNVKIQEEIEKKIENIILRLKTSA